MNLDQYLELQAQDPDPEPTHLPACPVTMADLDAAIRVALYMSENVFAAKVVAIVEGLATHEAACEIAHTIANPGVYEIH